MAPGPWRTPERDRLFETTLRLVNGILAVSSIWISTAFVLWLIQAVSDLFK
jgi:hypothetical protein